MKFTTDKSPDEVLAKIGSALAYASAVWLLNILLLALCPPLLWKKQERAVVGLLENI